VAHVPKFIRFVSKIALWCSLDVVNRVFDKLRYYSLIAVIKYKYYNKYARRFVCGASTACLYRSVVLPWLHIRW